MRWLPLLLVMACGDDLTFELRDGSRLRLHYWAYEDGTRQWDPTVFFDAALRADCTLVRWSDGHTYCTPASALVSYADDKCASPVGRVPSDSPPPVAFRRDFDFASERRPSRMYALGEERAALARFWLYLDNECKGPFADEGARYFDVEEVAMVRVKTRELRGDGRFSAMLWTSDDGMRAPSALHDSVVDSDCVPTRSGDASLTCRPVEVIDAAYFRDAGCSQPLLAIRDDQPVPSVARVTDELGCSSYARIGPEVANFPMYEATSNGCVEVALPDDERIFALGEPVVAPLAQEVALAGTRLQSIEVVDGSLRVPAPVLRDTTLDAMCERVELGEVALCIPRVVTATRRSFFRSDTCEGFMYGVTIPRRTCEPSPRYLAYTVDKTLRIAELLPPWTEPLFVIDETGSCSRFEPSATDDVRMLAGDVPLGTFVAAVRQ